MRQNSVKSINRQYRKALRSLSLPFPLRGAFHVQSESGVPIKPQDVRQASEITALLIVNGPAPEYTRPTLRRSDDNYFGDGVEGRDPLAPVDDGYQETLREMEAELASSSHHKDGCSCGDPDCGSNPFAPSQEAPDDLPALPEMYSRSERIGKDGKKRIDYRKVRNPKPNASYWVKRLVNGKSRYVELTFAKIVNGEQSEVA